MPDTYVSQFSGEEIDAALRAVLTASGGGINPNLLDNWFFGRPVNQRGQTEYTYTPTPSYTIDRWKADGNGTIMLKDGYIDVFNNNSWCSVMQYIDNPKYFAGKTLTASMLRRDENPLKLILYVDGKSLGEVLKTDKLVSITVTLPDNVSSLAILFGADANKTSSILAAKLELGGTQTLAHKENGVWVLNEIPDFGDQLRRCQRYALKIGDASRYCSLGTGVARDEQFVSFTIPTPVTMRTVPSLTGTPVGFTMRHSDVKVSGGETFAVDAASQNSVILKVKAQISLTAGEAYEAFLAPNGSLMLSADL